jgi:hypothetical protein
MMVYFAWISFLLSVFSIEASPRAVRTNNNELRQCLSDSLPPSVRTIYPCDTLANQNTQCDHFNASRLSSMSGGRIPHSPAVIVNVTNSNDVQNVVKCAAKLDYIVNALSGGHSYEAYSLGSTYNNIVINMASINYINVNPNDRTGTFGPSARLGPIHYTLYEQGQYTINAGFCVWVGLAGFALGGGRSVLSRSHGLLSDNVLEMKAVNAQGELLTINATHEPELYWALRGGGGGLFVIVTELKIRLIQSPSVVTHYSANWPPNTTKLVIQQYQSLFFDDTMSNLSNNISFGMAASTDGASISIVYHGPVLDEFNQTILFLLSLLPPPKSENIVQQDWINFVYRTSDVDSNNDDPRSLLLENLTYPTFDFKAKHLYYNQPISDQSLEQLVNQIALRNGSLLFLFSPWDGYLSTIPVDQTAFPHRNFKFGIQFIVYSNDQQELNWLNQVYLSVYNDSTKYSYINYIDRDVPNWMNVYYSTHQQRLINVKKMYDQNDRFYFERTIESNRGNQQTFFNYLLFIYVIFVSLIK